MTGARGDIHHFGISTRFDGAGVILLQTVRAGAFRLGETLLGGVQPPEADAK